MQHELDTGAGRSTPGPPRKQTRIGVRARSLERMRKEADVMGFTIQCDEPDYVGGDNTAPPPTAYLAVAISCCLLTQLGRYSYLHKVPIDSARAEVVMEFSTEGSVLAHTVTAHCDTIQTTVYIESPADRETIRTLLADAERGCYVMQAMRFPVDASLIAFLNERSLDDAQDDGVGPDRLGRASTA